MTIKQCSAEFLRGATRPSLAGLAGTLGVTVGIILLCAWKITPHLVANYPAYFEADDRDEFAQLTSQTLKIEESPTDGLSVVILGDSSIREAVTSPEDMERRVAAHLGRPVHVHLLVANGLTQWGATAITDVIRDHIKGVVLLEISPYNLSYGGEVLTEYVRTVAVNSDAFRWEVSNANLPPLPHTGIYLFDNYRFFIARPQCIWNLVEAPKDLEQHPQEHSRSWNDEQWRKGYRMAFEWIATYQTNRDMNLGIYERMIQRLRANPDIKVALYETIENPHLAELAKSQKEPLARKGYEEDLAEFEAAHTVPRFDCGPEAHLTKDDFWDPFHLRSDSGRERYTELLARHVAILLQAPVEDVAAVQASMAPMSLWPATTRASTTEADDAATHKKKKHK
jgi:hypothetical protein